MTTRLFGFKRLMTDRLALDSDKWICDCSLKRYCMKGCHDNDSDSWTAHKADAGFLLRGGLESTSTVSLIEGVSHFQTLLQI